MSYPGRGYSLPDALALVYPIKMIVDSNTTTELSVAQKAELVTILIDSGLSMRHICGSWVRRPAGNSTFIQFLLEELDEVMWFVLRDWVSGWVNEGFDIVEETAVIEFNIQGC